MVPAATTTSETATAATAEAPAESEAETEATNTVNSGDEDENAIAFSDTIEKIKDVDILPTDAVVKPLANGRRESTSTQEVPDDPPHILDATDGIDDVNNEKVQDNKDELADAAVVDDQNSVYSSSSSCSAGYGHLVINEGSPDSNDAAAVVPEAKPSLPTVAITLSSVTEEESEVSSSTAIIKADIVDTSPAIAVNAVTSTSESHVITTPPSPSLAATNTTATTTSAMCCSRTHGTRSIQSTSVPSAPWSPAIHDEPFLENSLPDSASETRSLDGMTLVNGDHINSSIDDVDRADVDAADVDHEPRTIKRKLSTDSETEEPIAEKRFKDSCDVENIDEIITGVCGAGIDLDATCSDVHDNLSSSQSFDNELADISETMCSISPINDESTSTTTTTTTAAITTLSIQEASTEDSFGTPVTTPSTSIATTADAAIGGGDEATCEQQVVQNESEAISSPEFENVPAHSSATRETPTDAAEITTQLTETTLDAQTNASLSEIHAMELMETGLAALEYSTGLLAADSPKSMETTADTAETRSDSLELAAVSEQTTIEELKAIVEGNALENMLAMNEIGLNDPIDIINSPSYMNGCVNIDRLPSPPTTPPPSSPPPKDPTIEMKSLLKQQLMFGSISDGFASAQRLGLRPSPVFKCFKCDTGQFQSLADLKDHQLVCLRSLDNNNSDKAQSLCVDRAQTPVSLAPTQGVAGHAAPLGGNSLPAIQMEAKAQLRIRKQVYLCAACGTYYENWHLFYHIREVHKNFICLFCLRIFATAEKLVNHLESKHITKPEVYEHKDGLIKSLKDQCYLMCCVCEHIFSECDDFTGHSCENYMSPCAHCSLKFIHKPNCSFAIKNKLAMKKTLPIATKPMMATMEQHRQQQIQQQQQLQQQQRANRKGEEENRKNGSIDANHQRLHSGSGAHDKFSAYEKRNAEAAAAAAAAAVAEPPNPIDNRCEGGKQIAKLQKKVDQNIYAYTSDEQPSSDAANATSDDEDSNNSNTESEQSPAKAEPKLNNIDSEPKVVSLKLKLSDLRRRQFSGDLGADNSDDSNDANDGHHRKEPNKEHANRPNYMNEHVSFQITASNDEMNGTSSHNAHGGPLLVPKLKLKIVKDFQPTAVESEESSTESDDGDPNDEDDLDESNSTESQLNVSADLTGSIANIEADEPILDVTQAAANDQEADLMPPTRPTNECYTEITAPAAVEDVPIDVVGMVPTPTASDDIKVDDDDADDSFSMDIDTELSQSNIMENLDTLPPVEAAPAPTNEQPLPVDAPVEVAAAALLAPAAVEPTPEEPAEIEMYRPIIDLLLDQPLDKLAVKPFIRKCLSASLPFCLYCNHARKIAVDGNSLAQHLVNNHRFAATVDSITAEELLPSTIEQRLKCSAEELVGSYFNLDSYDYRSDEPQPQPFVKTFECLQCRFQSLVYKDLYLHNRKMHLRAALICMMCRSHFFSYSELLSHMCPGESYKSAPIDLKFRCVLCNLEDIPSAFRLMVHLRKKHFACDVCLEECHDQSKLASHVWKHKLHHLCYRCNITYRNKADINKHLFWKHGTESVQCKRCLEKKWPHVYHFCVPPTKFTCESCGLVFSRAVSLKVHKRLHSPDGISYPCSEDNCEKRFISRKLLLKHVNRHYQAEERAPTVEEEEPMNVDIDVTAPASSQLQSMDIAAEAVDGQSNEDVKPVLGVELKDHTIHSETDGERSAVVDITVTKETVEETSKAEYVKENTAATEGDAVADAEAKQKEKKQKKKIKLTDLIDLPTPNLSESDSSDESENESSTANSALHADHSMQSFSSTINAIFGDAPCTETNDASDANDEDEETKPAAPMVDIWENFKTYQASQLHHDKAQEMDDDGSLYEVPRILHVNQSDHDYCMMYKAMKKNVRAPIDYSIPVPFIQHNHKGDINITYIEIEPEPVDDKEIITDEIKEVKESIKTEKKEKLSGSDSSSDSSDSDSSCSNCDSNCSCSSSSSGSSSSSSDSDSDSSDDNNAAAKKSIAKAEEHTKTSAVDDEQQAVALDNEDSSSKKELSPMRDRLKSETDVVDVDVETTDNKTPVVMVDPDSIINESDLDTAESDTDEDFYDDHPQKMSNQMLAEKRRELLMQAGMNEILENSRPSTPSLPEEVAREQRTRIKKRKRVRKSSKMILQQAEKSFHIPNDVPSPLLAVQLPPNHLPAMNHLAPIPNVIQTPAQQSMPSSFRAANTHPFIPNTPVLNTVASKVAATVTTPKIIAEKKKHLISESRMSTGSSCSDADSSLKRSKRRRIPNKFYGYTSDDDAPNAIPLNVNSSTLNPFKPIPPPNLTWSKDDLPEAPKAVHTPPLKTIIRLPSLSNANTPKMPRIPASASKSRPRKQSTKRHPRTPATPKNNHLPAIPPLIIRSNSVVKSVPSSPKMALTPFNESYPVRLNMTPPTSLSHSRHISENSSNDSDSDSDSSVDNITPTLTSAATQLDLQKPFSLSQTPLLKSHFDLANPATINSLIGSSMGVGPIPGVGLVTANNVANPFFNRNNYAAPTIPTPSSSTVNTNDHQTNQPMYCYCRVPYDESSNMIACDGSNCSIEWFHFQCVGIVAAPEDKWYCPQCRPQYVADDGNGLKLPSMVARNFINNLEHPPVNNSFQRQLPSTGRPSSFTTPSVT